MVGVEQMVRLRAENSRLRRQLENRGEMLITLGAENSALKAQVQRLKACSNCYVWLYVGGSEPECQACKNKSNWRDHPCNSL